MADETVTSPTSPAAPPTPPVPSKEPETFSREYVRELREENKNTRLKAQALEKERDDHKTAAEKATQEATEKITAAQQAANDRIIRAEMKAEAIKAGMIDLDGLKLADMSKVVLKDDGTIEGVEELMKGLKESKPYLFGTVQHSSTPGKPPEQKPPTDKKAPEMTKEEYTAAKKAVLKKK